MSLGFTAEPDEDEGEKMATNGPVKDDDAPADYMDLEHTGPGTLAGRYMRTFWHPIFVAGDLPPGQAVPIRIMNEDLTLYRGEEGAPHLLEFRCAHRGTQLSTGWIEDDCIRCRYHGWKYDGSGECVEQPMEQNAFTGKVRIQSFPIQEYLGLIFAYLGDGEPPAFPRYPALEEEGILDPGVRVRRCNYFNELENDIGHQAFTHRNPRLPKGFFYFPEVTVEENEFGLIWHLEYPEGQTHVGQIGMPNVQHMKTRPEDPESPWRTVVRWRVPIEDESYLNFWVYLIPVTGDAADRYLERRQERMTKETSVHTGQLAEAVLGGRLRLQDIETRADLNHSDIVNIQDDVTQIGQGRIRDRHQERLGRSDAPVILLRKLWTQELKAFAGGKPLTQWRLPRDPVIRDGYDRFVELPSSVQAAVGRTT